MWDIFFISFAEFNCEHNWLRLIEFHPNAKRIHGIVGIDRAHIACNNLSTTKYFWTVDGDNYLLKPLTLDHIPELDLIMFKSLDPFTKNTTGLGAVKLWRKDSFINTDMSKGDFCLNAVKDKTIIDHYFSISNYNLNKYDCWKTAFRHCVKLQSKILNNRSDANSLDKYIEDWQNTKTSTEQNAAWAYQGYLDSVEYIKLVNDDFTQLNKINNYEWLANYYKQKYETEL